MTDKPLSTSAGVTIPPPAKLPPLRNAVAGGLTWVVAWGLLALAQRYGIDPQPWVDTIFGAGAPNVLGLVAGALGFAVAHYLPLSLQDKVKYVDNELVTLANVNQKNGTTAKVVGEAESDLLTRQHVALGVVPPEALNGPLPPAPARVV